MAPGLTQPLTEMNEYQEYFLGGKGGRCVPYHLHTPTVLQSGILNLLEPSGPVQACTGNGLPLPFTFLVSC